MVATAAATTLPTIALGKKSITPSSNFMEQVIISWGQNVPFKNHEKSLEQPLQSTEQQL